MAGPFEGTEDDILLEIRRRLAERLELSLEEVGADAHVRDDLEAESMDMLVLVMDLEEEYGLKIPDDALPDLQTPRHISAYIFRLDPPAV